MTPKTKTSKKRTPKDGGRKGNVQNFADFQNDNSHKRFDEMVGQTIFIIKLEPLKSKTFGNGYRVHFKEERGSPDTFTGSVFSKYVVPQLDNVYALTNNGSRLSITSPIKATIEQAGKSYRFA